MAIGDDALELLEQEHDLRGGGRALARDKGAVARGLTQPQERLKRGEHALPRSEFLQNVGPRGRAHRVVDRALLRIELAAQDEIGAGRKLGRDLALAAPQHEGSDALAQAFGGRFADGPPSAIGFT